MSKDIIISPHDVCDSCNGPSGPKFSLYNLRGISDAQRNNEIPTGIDLRSRMNDVRNAKIDIDKLDIEIDRLHQTLKVLEQRRTDLLDFNHRELSLLAPVRRLPDDILKNIFVTCQQLLEKKPGYIQYTNPNIFVRTVTQVSNYWRNTALSTPMLWSRISFKKCGSTDKNMCISPGEFLQTCLHLSGSAPLSIEFAHEGYSLRNLNESSLMELAKAAHRWEHITMEDEYDGINLDLIMKYIPERTIFACLKTLGPLKSPNPHTLPPTPSLSHLNIRGAGTISLTSAPLLKDVYLTRYDYKTPQEVIMGFSWSQLTHYHSHNNFFGDDLATFLTSTPRLLSLTLNLGMTIQISTFMTLPQLQKLTLEFSSGRPANGQALKYFITPRLKELNMTGGIYYNKMIVDLLTRSECNIEKLSVPSYTLLDWNWNIDQMKNVKHLNVFWRNGFTKSPDVMKKLTFGTSPEHSDCIFPQLEIVNFDFSPRSPGHDTIPVEEFKAMLISRLPSNIKDREQVVDYIKSTTLTFRFDLPKSSEDLLNEFRTSDIIRQSNVDVTIVTKDML